MQSDSSDAPEAPLQPSKQASSEPIRVVVCVATYLRPEGLQRLLEALASASLSDEAPTVDVVVVDNDPEGSARAICERARQWLPFDLHYVIEKRRGIPQARNTALGVAVPFADFVVFTDDDVEPAPGWLPELLRVQGLYRADVVAGPNPPRFLDEPPLWVLEGHFFDGQQRSTGDLVDTAATHNVLVRCEVFKQMDRLFDERFALHGCTDTEFFRRVGRAGYHMVWAQDALAYECISASRMTLPWLLQRAYRIANGLGSSELRHLKRHTAPWVFVNGLKCLARGTVHLALAVALRRGVAARVQALLTLASGAGWLMGLFGLRYREYARVYGK
ncbi:MAG: glycosyltransferase family 2 protein [Deltaproteobacteria bacterium]|nr:glycosyltransferase family 2 protein [Deltaproteobacteria bacterium]